MPRSVSAPSTPGGAEVDRLIDRYFTCFENDDPDAMLDLFLPEVIAYMQDDDTVDELFNRIKNGLTELIRSSDFDAEAALDLLMVAKYFERIGDHAVNIAEWVEYSITGIRVNNESAN